MKVIDGAFGNKKEESKSDATQVLESFLELVQEWEQEEGEIEVVIAVSNGPQMGMGTNCDSEAHTNMLLDLAKKSLLEGALAGMFEAKGAKEEEADEPTRH